MASEYLHGYSTDEQRRLVAQAEHWRDELILEQTRLEPGTRLLEIGCGVGAVLVILAQAFDGIRLCGVDIDERQIDFARSHLRHHGLDADLRQADALDLPYRRGSFDHVWMMWFLEHLREPVAALREARRVLAPGGELTAIEVDYNTVFASPSTKAIDGLLSSMCRAMQASGHSDAGSRLPGWLTEAGFGFVDPGRRSLVYSGAELKPQLDYLAELLESVLDSLAERPDSPPRPRLQAGLADLRALASEPGASVGWEVHKARAAC